MKSSKNRNLNHLINEFAENISSDTEKAKSYVEEIGLNPDKVINSGVMRIKKLQAKLKREKATKNAHLFEKVKGMIKEHHSNLKQSNPIQSLLSNIDNHSKRTKVQLFFRDIQDLDENDALQMLEDLNILEELNERIKNNDKKIY